MIQTVVDVPAIKKTLASRSAHHSWKKYNKIIKLNNKTGHLDLCFCKTICWRHRPSICLCKNRRWQIRSRTWTPSFDEPNRFVPCRRMDLKKIESIKSMEKYKTYAKVPSEICKCPPEVSAPWYRAKMKKICNAKEKMKKIMITSRAKAKKYCDKLLFDISSVKSDWNGRSDGKSKNIWWRPSKKAICFFTNLKGELF